METTAKKNAEAASPALLPGTDSSSTSAPVAFEEQLESVLSLIMDRTKGKASNELIETAVAGLISQKKGPLESVVPTHHHHTAPATNAVQQDEDDYDNEDDDDEPSKQASHASSSAASAVLNKDPVQWTGEKATLESLQKQQKEEDAKEKKASATSAAERFYQEWDDLDSIPLGTAGARMMVTFGDGRKPKAEAVSVALLGARVMMQNALKDARGLRRQMKRDYNKAKAALNINARPKAHQYDPDYEMDPNMMYRVLEGYDKLAYEPKCGFDVAQLEILFPEEMNAYKRWKDMHKAYEKSKDTEEGANSPKRGDEKAGDADADADENDDEADSSKKEKGQQDDDEVLVGGHLDERLAQFDARTQKMKEDWYMAFAEVRQGSFLQKAHTQEDRQWDKARKKIRQGKRNHLRTSWETLPATSIQFLHWLGFDQRSALQPPNEATTQALAFLGYDFMGKIVEKVRVHCC
mmetsp:Transcript_24055/g.43492  ORF Transcript_24055/g.43492 Transcript_24055/m.43492 type:complete len:466 (-) Transcript_24055:25-1422(-)